MSQNPLKFLIVVLTLTLLTSGEAMHAGVPIQPNIIVINVDDLRWDALSSTGHPFLQNPNIDRIAKEGLTFRNAFVSTPLCSPSRATLYTGQYARTHGVKGNGGNNAVSDLTLSTYAPLLQQAGYMTAHVGKWHMNPTHAPRPGFDYWVSFKGQGSHRNVTLNVNGNIINTTGLTTDVLTAYAINFIEQNHGGKPFAMMLAYKAVHFPFPNDQSNVPVHLRTLYENKTIPQPPSALLGYTLDGKPMLQNPPPGLNPPVPGRTVVPGRTGSTRNTMLNQLRMMAHIDENIGRLLTTLEDSNQLNNTLLLFTSDNGYFWGEHGLGEKRAAYDESIRIPMLMRLPSIIPVDTETDGLVVSADVAPTLLDLAGADIPDTMQGKSLLPIMSNPMTDVRKSFLAEYFQDQRYPRIHTWKAVRTEHYKYITYPDSYAQHGLGWDELYDLTADLYEMTNLISDAAAQPVLKQMRQKLVLLEQELNMWR
jgi:arylsulfatase A-like enzyme